MSRPFWPPGKTPRSSWWTTAPPKDDTPAICDEFAAKYPTIVKAIHQENGGHGEGVNQGLRNATGLYYKVVDSDDWLDTDSCKSC